MVSAARFGQGMTFDEYLRFIASPANLAREGSAAPRRDWSDYLRQAYDAARIPTAHAEAWRWLVAHPGGPARVLALSEEWSSDCRRDIPVVARLADTAGLELRIFTRDGQTMGRAPFPQPDSPNADLMADFLNRRDGETFQSIPIIAFYTKDLELLYRYTEFPAVYRKDRIRGALNRPAAGETEAAGKARGDKAFAEMLASPFHEVWRAAALDEWTAIVYERLRVGSLT
jgi:Thioredoxin